MKNNGFTLIELLVVIAIIGLLSSIILVSVDSSRVKARDVAVKAGMKNAKTQADAYYEMNFNYTGICGAGGTYPSIYKIIAAAAKAGGVAAGNPSLGVPAGYATSVCNANSSGWAAEVPMAGSVFGAARMFCIDSLGAFEETTGLLGVAGVPLMVCP